MRGSPIMELYCSRTVETAKLFFKRRESENADPDYVRLVAKLVTSPKVGSLWGSRVVDFTGSIYLIGEPRQDEMAELQSRLDTAFETGQPMVFRGRTRTMPLFDGPTLFVDSVADYSEPNSPF